MRHWDSGDSVSEPRPILAERDVVGRRDLVAVDLEHPRGDGRSVPQDGELDRHASDSRIGLCGRHEGVALFLIAARILDGVEHLCG